VTIGRRPIIRRLSIVQLVSEADAPYHYLRGKHRKQSLVNQIERERKPADGLIAVLCCLEIRPGHPDVPGPSI
jgi:hypothetical protein